ncbi:hypothetical protein PYW08_012029 [Mythimna loreyi]|uniref:Uncharacterized protein n=1 Tax=Mythimna loreyi TaxID=667449 RepID=A0ACC2QL24_9NEOP|nr:hypothetical protein PYW08_012029 [Mythimna loreyi]
MSRREGPRQYCAPLTMRLHAFLLVAGAALCAQAATIPVETDAKLIDVVPDNLDKLPENTSSEQELIDQANTIKDVDNTLRTKPEDIPVEVIVENAQPALKADEEDEEIDRPLPDLRNPGPPQRQEHETQNPEYYASEQQTVALLKQSINEAQNVLRQGFQGITDGIQHIAANNEPIQSLQKNIQALRDSFTAQMVKVNATIQSYLNSESVNIDKPAPQQTKAIHQVEQGLFKLRNEFNRGVSTLAEGVDLVALLKADSEAQTEGSVAPATDNTSSSPPTSGFTGIVETIQQNVQQMWSNFQTSVTQLVQGNLNQGSNRPPAGAQSDSQVPPAPPAASTPNIFENIQNQFNNFLRPNQTQNQVQIQNDQAQNPSQPGLILGVFPAPQPGQFFSGTGPFQQIINNVQNLFQPNRPISQAPQGTQPAGAGQPAQTPTTTAEAATKPESKPEAQAEPAKPEPQATAVTPSGPIRQILQNNPITQSIAGAVQRLQNINNPEKPREEQPTEQIKKLDQDNDESVSQKGHGPNSGDNNDSSISSDRVEQPEPVKEEMKKVPEVQEVPEAEKVLEEEVKEHKTEEVADKTE